MNTSLATPRSPGPANPLTRLELVTAAVLVATLVALVHGALLGAWFHPIDDGIHLLAVQEGRYPLPHFRPLHELWNRVCFASFGTEPLGWHAAQLVVHSATVWLLYVLLRLIGLARAAAALGAASFAVLRGPSEAVAWISAVSGVLAVFFVVLSAVCWWCSLEEERRPRRIAWTVGAVLALCGAAGSKEDCVLAAPLLVGLHVYRSGWRSLATREAVLRYAPFVVVGVVYLALAFDPSAWTERRGVGEYSLRVELVPRLFANLALLAWPGSVGSGALPSWTALAGLAAVCGALVAALRMRLAAPRASRAIVFGLSLAAFGLLPALPGPWSAIASSRLGYAAALGAAWVVAGFTEASTRAASQRRVTSIAATSVLALFVLAHAAAVHRTIPWRYVDASRNFEAVVARTFELASASQRESALFLAPPGWNALDHTRTAQALAAQHGVVVERVEVPLANLDEELAAWRTRADLLVWSPEGWRPLATDGADRERLTSAARANEQHGFVDTVPGTWVHD